MPDPRMEQPKIFQESELEVFQGDFIEKMQGVVKWIDEKVQRVKWTDLEIEKKFTTRNAQEILTEGKTGYMNPCNDLTLAAYALLKKNGFKPKLVVCKLKYSGSNFIHMHFALEFVDDIGGVHSLDFKTMNQVVLSDGKYKYSREGVELILEKKIDTEVSFNENMESILEKSGFDLSGFDLEFIKEKLKKDNSDETFKGYSTSAEKINNGRLYLDVQESK